MEQHDILRQTVATFLGMEPQQIQPVLPLTGTRLHDSLARARLYAVLQQRLGVQCHAAFTARTYGELHSAVFGAPAVEPEAIPLRRSRNEDGAAGLTEQTSHASGLACGIDIEMVDHLPVVQDYWEDPFYTMTFTPSEIAYCLLQANPPMHFAARWCAKEALKKCDAGYRDVAMNQLEVAVTPTGAPFLQFASHGTWARLPVALSLSHTPFMAAAVVVKPPAVHLTNNGVTAPVVLPSSTLSVPSSPVSPLTPSPRLGGRMLSMLLRVIGSITHLRVIHL